MSLTQQLNNQVIKFVTLGVIGIGALVVPQAAKATECFNGDGYTMCFEQTGRSGSLNRWTLQVNNQYTTETMDVTCDGKFLDTWSSYGGASEAEARQLAAAFCAL